MPLSWVGTSLTGQLQVLPKIKRNISVNLTGIGQYQKLCRISVPNGSDTSLTPPVNTGNPFPRKKNMNVQRGKSLEGETSGENKKDGKNEWSFWHECAEWTRI